MRRLALTALAAAALSLLACKGPCEDLGERLCSCAGAGSTRDACERAVESALDDANPSGDLESFCDARLGTCNAPAGARFCEWVETPCGRASCGLSSATPEAACAPAEPEPPAPAEPADAP